MSHYVRKDFVPIKVLVTGSRDWTKADIIGKALLEVQKMYPGRRMLLIHGACPTGADIMADEWAKSHGWDVIPYPADWSKGKREGPDRNKRMIDNNPDIVMGLAFLLPSSKGTVDCRDRMLTALIPVREFHSSE